MKFNVLKKIIVTGLSTAICVGGVSMANLSNYNGNTIEAAYAAVIKDNPFTATGTVTSNVSMRKGPGTSYARLATLKKGTKVDIVAKSSNSWYKVKYNKGYAYVYSQYINLNKTEDDFKYPATGTVNSAVFVIKGASTSYTKLGKLQKNDKVTILSKTTYGWYKINYKNTTGYVYGQYITLDLTK